MINILKEFKIALGLDFKTFLRDLDRVDSEVSRVSEHLKNVLSTFLSFSAISQVTKFGVGLKNTTDLLGVSSESFEYLSRSLEIFGGGVSEAKGSIQSLNSAFQSLKYGQGPLIELAGKYGLAIKNQNGQILSQMEFLQQLATRFETLDANSRLDVGGALGLDESLILMLSKGRKEFDRLIEAQKGFGFYSENSKKMTFEFNEQILKFQNSLKLMGRNIVELILPVLNKFLTIISDLFKRIANNRTAVITFFGILAASLLSVAGAAARLAIAWAAAYAPLALIASAALVIQDIWGYFNGWDSVTGKLVDKFKALKPILETIKPIVLSLGDTFQSLITWLENPTWENFNNILKQILATLSDMLFTAQKLFAYIIDYGVQGFNKIAEFFGFKGTDFSAVETSDRMRQATREFIVGANNNTNNSQTTNNINQTFNVNSPQQASMIADRQRDQINAQIERMR